LFERIADISRGGVVTVAETGRQDEDAFGSHRPEHGPPALRFNGEQVKV
jgi:hypothetical protein